MTPSSKSILGRPSSSSAALVYQGGRKRGHFGCSFLFFDETGAAAMLETALVLQCTTFLLTDWVHL